MIQLDASEFCLIVIAKQPRPGFSKTRLTPPLSPPEAAALAEAALADTLASARRSIAGRRLLALAGEPGAWLPDGFELVAQADGGLDARLAAAFESAGGPALLIGMDTPQLTTADIDEAIEELARDGVDAVLGPAPDGGYWAIGLRAPVSDAFAGVPMSSGRTAAEQRKRLDSLGLSVAELQMVRDFDTIDDARAVAGLCGGSRFARAFEALAWPRPA
jgi:rSAM/selenodomain-associated transferase 1